MCRLDRGATKIQFFIAVDGDGHQWLVSSGPLGIMSEDVGQCADRRQSPVRPCLERIALPSKDLARARLDYSQLFHGGTGTPGQLLPGVRLDVVPLYHLRPGDERLQFKAADADAAYRHVRSMGCRIIRGLDPFKDGSRGFIAEDPDGTPFTIREQ